MASTAEFDFELHRNVAERALCHTDFIFDSPKNPSAGIIVDGAWLRDVIRSAKTSEYYSSAYLDLLAWRDLPPDPRTFVCYPSIQLRSGAYYDFTNPPDILASDIAAGLRISRFNAHTRGDLYTVAQHCVLGTGYAPDHLKFPFLMHDAPESVYNDMTTPLKQLLPDYKKVTKRVDAKFAQQFHLPLKMPCEIKEIDLRMAATEKRDLMPVGAYWPFLDDIEPFPESITPWSPQLAMSRWLEMFEDLWPQHLDMWRADPERIKDQLYVNGSASAAAF